MVARSSKSLRRSAFRSIPTARKRPIGSWDAIVRNGGEEGPCGWCKDKFGLSWQIVPSALLRAFADSDKAAAKRAMDAMMGMKRIDIAAIERARAGGPVS